MKFLIVYSLCLVLSAALSAQNLGVNTPNPSQPLEVGGIIFTNEGGVMFPDSTIQTSAAAQSGAEDATDENKSYGVMVISGIAGPYTDEIYTEAFKVYDLQSGLLVPDLSGATFFNGITVVTDIGPGFPSLIGFTFQQQVNPEVVIELQDAGNNPYVRFTLETAEALELQPYMHYRGGGEYAHLYSLKLTCEKLTVELISTGECFCWDIQTNMSCGCL